MRATRLTWAGLLVTAGLVAACAVFRSQGGPAQTYPLIVNNRTSFDVTIFAVPSPGSLSVIRIGDSRPMSLTTLTVTRNALQPQEILQLRVHAIGSARSVRSWLSPAQQLDSTLAAELDVRANPNGDLSRSTLFAQPRDLIKKP